MEDEVRDILRTAVKDDAEPASGLGSDIARLFADCGLNKDIPELRGHTIADLPMLAVFLKSEREKRAQVYHEG